VLNLILLAKLTKQCLVNIFVKDLFIHNLVSHIYCIAINFANKYNHFDEKLSVVILGSDRSITLLQVLWNESCVELKRKH